MRKLLLSIGAAGTMMALATPASAQWHRPGYGYNTGPLANLARDVQQIRMDRDNLMHNGRLSGNQARDVDNDIRSVQFAIDDANRRGASPVQVRELQDRVFRLRNEVRRYANGGSWGWHRR